MRSSAKPSAKMRISSLPSMLRSGSTAIVSGSANACGRPEVGSPRGFSRASTSASATPLFAAGRPIVALGTTTLRALEAAATAPRTVTVGQGATELFIYPGSGHAFRVVDHLVTNFHLPESTLLMLACAFAGTGRVLAGYRHAVAHRYRFFSYGDATLLHRA